MNKKYVIGVDVGGTSVKLGLFYLNGDLIEKWSISTDIRNGGKNILPDTAKAIKDKLYEKVIDKKDCLGVGLGVPGPVTKDGIVKGCVNLGWDVFNVEKELSNLTELSVKATNDANVAALGEMWQGSAKGYKNFLFITIGTGVGGGLIIDEKPVRGINGSGGEIGHLLINPHEKQPCNCGRYGCVEQYASATGIVRIASDFIEKGENTVLKNRDTLSAETIFDAAKSGDNVGIKCVDIMADVLGKALSYGTGLCDTDVILIGGGVSKAGEYLLKQIKSYYQKYAFPVTKDTPIVLAQLGNDAGIYGAAKYMLQEN